jgi:hypothetical protein
MNTTRKHLIPDLCSRWLSLMSISTLLSAPALAAIPTPDRLLPDDTLVVVTAPDFSKVRDLYRRSPQTKLWSDPAMKPFRDHFMTKLEDEIIQPLERELGVSLEQYASLPQGQLTIALTPGSGDSGTPGFLLLVDAKDKSGLLKTNLADLKRKWIDSGKSLKTERIRDIEFSILPLSSDDLPETLQKFAGSDEDAGDDNSAETNDVDRIELVIGQFDSLLILGNSLKSVEKVAVRLTGGSTPALADLAAFETSRAATFRDAPAYGWANAKALIDLLVKHSSEKESENPMAAMFNVQKIMTATGVIGLRTVAASMQDAPEGVSVKLSLGVPEADRQGLFRLFPEAGKESLPPAFVPADAVKFSRVRLDGQKTWATLRAVLGEISPDMVSSLDFMLDTANEAARQKDPNFDLRKNLFGNLGDDLISYEKSAKGKTLAELNSAPGLILIGSPQPEQLASGLKALLMLMNQQAGAPKERDFLGRKVYTLEMPVPAGGTSSTLHYAASSGYVAITTDVTLLEEYLRSADAGQKQLREKEGLMDAVARAGGGSTGWFAYENQAETTRTLLEILRQSSSASETPEMLAPGIPAFTPDNPFKEWVDFSKLPPFEQIAKYFSFMVYTGSATSQGIDFNFFSPIPPGLRQ